LQVKLCDPHLSALEVRFSRQGAIQIYVYLYLYLLFVSSVFAVWSDCVWSVCTLSDECQLSLLSKLMTTIVNKAIKTTRAVNMDAKRYEVCRHQLLLILQTSHLCSLLICRCRCQQFCTY